MGAKDNAIVSKTSDPVHLGKCYHAHCHFYGLGLQQQNVELSGTNSFDQVVQRIVDFQKEKNASQPKLLLLAGYILTYYIYAQYEHFNRQSQLTVFVYIR